MLTWNRRADQSVVDSSKSSDVIQDEVRYSVAARNQDAEALVESTGTGAEILSRIGADAYVHACRFAPGTPGDPVSNAIAHELLKDCGRRLLDTAMQFRNAHRDALAAQADTTSTAKPAAGDQE